MWVLHAGDDHVGGQSPDRYPTTDRAADSRRPLREFLPVHRLPPYRQRDPARCGTEVVMGALPILPKLVGERVKRREDPRLIQGRGTYVDDIKIAGMQHVAFKRSDVAHGRIRSIDTSAAKAMAGVEAVFTGAEIAEFLAPMPIGTPFPSPDHRAVAVDTVRYSGEPVAVVVAADRYVARDAIEAINVSYDMLPAVVDVEEAMTGKPTVIHSDFAKNLAVALVPRGTGVSEIGRASGRERV